MRILAVVVASIWLFSVPKSYAFSRDLMDVANMALQNSPAQNRLVTNKMCPYAQKAWIALEASNTPYELQEISLYGSNGKPDWFRKLNPAGTVPVLVTNGGAVVLPDSDLILDQYEKSSSSSQQLGSMALFAPESEAAIQQWRLAINNKLIPTGKKSVLAGRGMSQDLKIVLAELDAMVVGPYLAGNKISTADCHAFPFLWRLHDEYGLDDFTKLQEWTQRCSGEACFKKTIQSSWWWWWWW